MKTSAGAEKWNHLRRGRSPDSAPGWAATSSPPRPRGGCRGRGTPEDRVPQPTQTWEAVEGAGMGEAALSRRGEPATLKPLHN